MVCTEYSCVEVVDNFISFFPFVANNFDYETLLDDESIMSANAQHVTDFDLKQIRPLRWNGLHLPENLQNIENYKLLGFFVQLMRPRKLESCHNPLFYIIFKQTTTVFSKQRCNLAKFAQSQSQWRASICWEFDNCEITSNPKFDGFFTKSLCSKHLALKLMPLYLVWGSFPDGRWRTEVETRSKRNRFPENSC